MKLRNKKTGEIESVSIDTFGVDGKDRRIGISVLDFSSPSDYRCIASYSSLAELNEEWEDYKPKEPLIKDEKIDYLEIKRLVKEAIREAEEKRVKRLAQYYKELCGEEEENDNL